MHKVEHGVECIEQEMRIDLRLKSGELCLSLQAPDALVFQDVPPQLLPGHNVDEGHD
jgi:hypothetical protein